MIQLPLFLLIKTLSFVNGVNHILASASFEIIGWHSNFQEVDKYPSEMTTTVMGHNWNKSSDMLKPQLPIVTISEPMTKRVILSSMSQLWYPLVFSHLLV